MTEDITGRPLYQLLLSVPCRNSLQVWGINAIYYCQCFYVGDALETEIPLQVTYP